jgi:hypothetical protein
MTKIEFTRVKGQLLAIVSPLSRKEGAAMVRYMGDRNLLAHFTFDGIGKLEFFVPQNWGWEHEKEDHARRYVTRVLNELRETV